MITEVKPAKTPMERIDALHKSVMRTKLQIPAEHPSQVWLTEAMRNLETAAGAERYAAEVAAQTNTASPGRDGPLIGQSTSPAKW